MFGSTVLDVLLGLSLVYLLLSLICSAIREVIEAKLKTRASDLERGIRELLHEHDFAGITEAVYSHPLVASLYNGIYRAPGALASSGERRQPKGDPARTNLPSYIPASNFALALLDIAARGKPAGVAKAAARPQTPAASGQTQTGGGQVQTPESGQTQAGGGQMQTPESGQTQTGGGQAQTPASGQAADRLTLQSVRDNVSRIGNPLVERALLVAIDTAGDDLAKAQKNVEAWFNSSMDRVSGLYKRRTQRILFWLGLGVTIFVNVNTITIATALTRNPALRESVVAEAGRTVASGTIPEADRKERLRELNSLRLPIGWNDGYLGPPEFRAVGTWEWWNYVSPVLGWALTALAITLGAPFWFDLLNKIMVIRSTVKPHEKSPEEASEDRQSKGKR